MNYNKRSNHDSCHTCGTCRENGRIWIDCYHGQDALSFIVDQPLINNIAALDCHGVNLSECCVPVLKASIKNLTDQLIKPVAIERAQLTKDINENLLISDDIVTIATGVVDETALETFFEDTDLTICKDEFDVDYTVDVSGSVATVTIEFTKSSIALASYELTADISNIAAGKKINFFGPSGGVGAVLIVDDTVLTIEQLPSFVIEADANDDQSIRVLKHLIVTCKENSLTNFILCPSENTCDDIGIVTAG